MSNLTFRPYREMNLVVRIRYELVRRTFTGTYRQPFYETLRFLLENKKSLEEALRMIGDVHTDFGHHWHPYSDLIEDCLEATSDNTAGRSIQDVFLAWAPSEEAALISAGITSGNTPVALAQVDKLIMARRRILSQLVSASIYPIILVNLGGGLLFVNNSFLIPTLAKLSPPETWNGILGFMYQLSELTAQYGAVASLGLLAVCGVTFWSLPRWAGRLRQVFDLFMPWSLYKDMQGAVFLMNISALIGAGVPELKALLTLRSFGSPWLQERLDAVIDRVNNGEGMGMALRSSGYKFPSKESANYLSLLGKGDGASTLISNYADRWLEQALKKVARRANAIKLFSLLLIIIFFLLMLGMVMQIQDMTHTSPH